MNQTKTLNDVLKSAPTVNDMTGMAIVSFDKGTGELKAAEPTNEFFQEAVSLVRATGRLGNIVLSTSSYPGYPLSEWASWLGADSYFHGTGKVGDIVIAIGKANGYDVFEALECTHIGSSQMHGRTFIMGVRGYGAWTSIDDKPNIPV